MRTTFFILFISFIVISCKNDNAFVANTDKRLDYSAKDKYAVVYTTSKDTNLRLSLTDNLEFKEARQALETEITIFVKPEKQFQTFLGIGGAITDAAAETFYKLSESKRNQVLNAYFGEDGIAYNLIRTPIHSCDFSSESYTYIDEGDDELKTFSINRDKKYKISFIKEAMKLIKDDFVFYASPWSPPAFMKSNKNMLQGGKLLPEYYQAWANYYVKFIEAYEAQGMPVWGITIQNEPMATQRWESCIYTAEEERDFLKNYLGPTMEKAGYGDKNIVVWDHNRDLITNRTNVIFGDTAAAKYAWGSGFHWYETWTGSLPNFENLRKVKENFPDKELMFTEGTNEAFDTEKYQYWPNAERYGQSMINDFNCGTAAWTDWNILLDETGGPNHVGNFCFSPIHGDTQKDSVIVTPSYYYIGHFSKFIEPGARRVSTSTSRTTLLSTSFLNENGKMATVIMNETNSRKAYKLTINSMSLELEIPARAIQTIVY